MPEEVRLPVDLQLQRTFEGRAHHQVKAFAWFQVQLAEVAQFVGIVGVYAADDVSAPRPRLPKADNQ